jgi:drug/metabolite transporter (DMT)-like permease
MKAENLSRMLDWLVWALCFHLAAILLRTFSLEPQIQTVLWKLGNLTLAAYAGYWIDRRTFRMRVDSATPAPEQIRRAIIVAAAMIAVGLGL